MTDGFVRGTRQTTPPGFVGTGIIVLLRRKHPEFQDLLPLTCPSWPSFNTFCLRPRQAAGWVVVVMPPRVVVAAGTDVPAPPAGRRAACPPARRRGPVVVVVVALHHHVVAYAPSFADYLYAHASLGE